MAAQTFHKQTDRLNEIKQTLQTVMDNYHESPEKIAEMLAFKSKFYNYSINNTVLIYSQNPFSTYVASFRDWNKKGYHVRKGQHGIKVLFPIRTELIVVGEENGKKKYKRVVDANPEEKEMIANGELKPVTLTRFGVGTVFDISQTDCPPEDYPKIFDMGFSSDQHAELYRVIKNFSEKKGIPVIETDLQSISLRGAFYPLENVIRISDKLNDTERLSTLTHELGHALMHNSKEAFELPTEIKEFEADAISIMLQQYVGIDLTDSRKRHFVQNYNACIKSKDFSLDEVLKAVNSTYFNLRNELEPVFEKLQHVENVGKQADRIEFKKETVVVNGFGGPGAGKTTACFDIVSEFKKRGFVADYVPEYATELVWDNNLSMLDGSEKNQQLLLKEQKHRIDRLIGKVDFVVTDSPLLLNTIYNKELTPDYENMVRNEYSQYNNFNFVIQRDDSQFVQKGRIHNLSESKIKDKEILNLLSSYGLYYGIYKHETVGKIIDNAIQTYQRINREKEISAEKNARESKNDLKQMEADYITSAAEEIAPLEQSQRDEDNIKTQNPSDQGKMASAQDQRKQPYHDYKEQDAAVLNYIKHDVPLLTVASDMGFTPVKTGGYYSLKEHDSVRIYQDTNSFYRFSTGTGGSTIDFMMQFGGFSEKEAIQKLKDQYVGNRFDTIQPVEKHEQKPKPAPEKKEFVLPDKVDGKYSRSYAYLVKTRCLDPEIVQECFKSGLIYEDNKHNAVFVGKDKDGIAAFATRHTSLTGSSFKRDVAGSRQDIGWMVNNKSDRLYICEAPIDALSIMSLRKRQGLPVNAASYLATCGTGKDAALYTRLRENPQIKEVILANDTDAAGKKANKKIAEKLSKEYPDIRVKLLSPHKGKDINDCLRNIVAPPKTREKGMEVER